MKYKDLTEGQKESLQTAIYIKYAEDCFLSNAEGNILKEGLEGWNKDNPRVMGRNPFYLSSEEVKEALGL